MFIFFHVYMLKFDEATYFSHLFSFILSVRFSNRGSDIPLFLDILNIVTVLFYNLIEFILLLFISLVISFAWFKEYMICLNSISKFSDELPAFTCPNAIDDLWSVCFGVNVLIFEWSKTLSMQATRDKSGYWQN